MTAPSSHQVLVAVTHFEYLREQLKVQFPDADDETIADTLEGISDLDQMLVAVMRSTEDDAMLVAGINERIGELQERRARLTHRIDTKRDVVCRVMERADLRRIEAPDFTLSLRNLPFSLVIDDDTQVPETYWHEKVTRSIDKKALGDALKADDAQPIPGARLSNGGVGLTVRKK